MVMGKMERMAIAAMALLAFATRFFSEDASFVTMAFSASSLSSPSVRAALLNSAPSPLSSSPRQPFAPPPSMRAPSVDRSLFPYRRRDYFASEDRLGRWRKRSGNGSSSSPPPPPSFASPWSMFSAAPGSDSAATTLSTGTTTGEASEPSPPSEKRRARTYRHTLAVLTLPRTSADRIANEAILETAMRRTSRRLSVVLRCPSYRPSLSRLRGYVGEVYSSAWDITLGFDDSTREVSGELLDVIVYPQNLPNAAPENWIHRRPDLECVCSHDSITGWSSDSAGGTGLARTFRVGDGLGGLDQHVDAINSDRASRGLAEVVPLRVEPWPVGADVWDDEHVVFLDDSAAVNERRWGEDQEEEEIVGDRDYDDDDDDDDDGTGDNEQNDGDANEKRGDGTKNASDKDDNDDGRRRSAKASISASLLGGPRVRDKSLYDSVCVGGTFDGMHYGHRKLLTLAVSSVRPGTGRLLVGVTKDEMLSSKSYREWIPPMKERIRGVRDYLDALAPGLKNRVRIVPIEDEYGPPGTRPGGDQSSPSSSSSSSASSVPPNDFDALVLSHETLATGQRLNEHRVNNLNLKPLMLLCTRRTEPHGMSSTALRRMRNGLRPDTNMF